LTLGHWQLQLLQSTDKLAFCVVFVKGFEENTKAKQWSTEEAQVDGTAFCNIFGPVLALRKPIFFCSPFDSSHYFRKHRYEEGLIWVNGGITASCGLLFADGKFVMANRG
jgi:hypothetical protein